MGYDAYAVALIGVRVDPVVLHATIHKLVAKRGCKHSIREDEKFCSECGTKAYVPENITIKEYGWDDDGETLCGYPLVKISMDALEFIAYKSFRVGARNRRHISIDDLDLVKIKFEMQAKLEPLELFHEEAFGLHVFLDESC